MKFLYFIYYISLFVIRTNDAYLDYLVLLYLFWAAVIFVSIFSRNPTNLLTSFVNLAFLENADLFDYSISIPFFLIGLTSLVIFLRSFNNFNIAFVLCTLPLTVFFPLSFLKDFLVFSMILILSSASSHSFAYFFKHLKVNWNQINFNSFLILLFWISEYCLVFVAPHLRYSIGYSFDFRPIGFYTETSWFTSLLVFLFLARLMPKAVFSFGFLVPFLALSRAYLITIFFYFRVRSLLVLLLVCFVVFVFVFGDFEFGIGSRLVDFADSARFERAFNSSFGIIPSINLENKASGVFFIQLISVFGLLLAFIYVILFCFSLMKSRNWLPFLFFVVSFVHPIHFTSVFLLSLIVPPLVRKLEF